MNKINIELFRFNARTDYLPYYKKYTLAYDATQSINDLLHTINAIDAFGFDDNMNVKVNSSYVNARTLVRDMVAQYGMDLRIDPISELRAQEDLKIDRSDFIEKLSLIDKYIDAEKNIAYRKSTELAYYASNTLNYNRDYIGDHVLIIAADLIEQKFELRNEILDLLISEVNGIWYHTSLEKRLGRSEEENKIQKLIYLALEYIKPRTKLAKRVAAFLDKTDISGFEENMDSGIKPSVAQLFKDFNIASYDGVEGSELESLVYDSQANYISLNSRREDLAPNSALIDESFSLKIAGDILVEAKDNNADFLLVKNEKTKNFFDKNQSKMEKLVGRELGMSVVSQEQFTQLLKGEKDSAKLGFDEHKVAISFL